MPRWGLAACSNTIFFRYAVATFRHHALALAGSILYKPAFADGFERPAAWAARAPLQEISHGRSETKNLAVAPRHAPVRRRPEEAHLCRGQGFGRIAPSAPHRPEDRHVSRPPGAQGQDRSLIKAVGHCRAPVLGR